MTVKHMLIFKGKSLSIKKFYIYSVISCVCALFSISLLVFLPTIFFVSDKLSHEKNNAVVKAYASQLESYIQARELALYDIASSAILVNSVLMNDGENSVFRDYIAQITVLGENPGLIVLDAFGGVIYDEIGYQKGGLTHREWVAPLLNASEKKGLVRVRSLRPAQFEIAVPLLYGQQAEGVLVATVSADPKDIYGSQISTDTIRLSYRIDDKEINFGIAEMANFIETYTSSQYPIEFTYTHHLSAFQLYQENIVFNAVVLFSALVFLFMCLMIALGYSLCSCVEIVASQPHTSPPTADT